MSYNSQGHIARDERRIEAAAILYRKSWKLWKQIGSVRGMGFTEINLGEVERDRKKYEKALESYRSARNRFYDLNDLWGLAQVYLNLAELERDRAHYDEAEEQYVASLELFRDCAKTAGILDCIEGLAVTAYGHGKLQRAVRLCCATVANRQQRQIRLLAPDQERFTQFVAALQASMRPNAFEALCALGSQLSLEDALQEALAGNN